MKFVLMTYSYEGNHIVSELVKAKLKPTLIVTDSPFSSNRKNPIMRSLANGVHFLKSLTPWNDIINRYPPYFQARRFSVPIMATHKANSDEMVEFIKNNDIDYVFTFCFKLLKEKVFRAPKRGCINYHPALLPMHRGATPIHWVVFENEKQTGVTIHFINKKIDEGDIIDQVVVNLTGMENSTVVSHYLDGIGISMLIRLMYRLKMGYEISAKENLPQNGSYEPPFNIGHRTIACSTLEGVSATVRASYFDNKNARYKMEGKNHQVLFCVDMTDVELKKSKFPYILDDGNILMQTDDGKTVLLVTKN